MTGITLDELAQAQRAATTRRDGRTANSQALRQSRLAMLREFLKRPRTRQEISDRLGITAPNHVQLLLQMLPVKVGKERRITLTRTYRVPVYSL